MAHIAPLEDILKQAEKGFPIHKIGCRLENHEKFLNNLLYITYLILRKQGKIKVEGKHYPEFMYALVIGMRELANRKGKKIPARKIREELQKMYGDSGTLIPSVKGIEKWLAKKRAPSAHPGLTFLSEYLTNELDSLINFQLYFKNEKIPLDVLLIMADEICGFNLDFIQSNIYSMHVPKDDTGGAILVLQKLFEADEPLSTYDLSGMGLPTDDIRDTVNSLEDLRFISTLSKKHHKPGLPAPIKERLVVLRGDEDKLRAI